MNVTPAMIRATTPEKRKHPRIHTEFKVRFRILRKSDLVFTDDEAVSHDMSVGGLALALSQQHPLAKDDMLRLEVLEGEASGLRAYAEVAWSHDDKAGLRFMGILDEDLERLGRMVQQQGN
jgi:hypothetical protein